MSTTWFITGTSRGFGRLIAEGALARGDRVAATARNRSTLDGLVTTYGDAVLPLSLDVTDRDAAFRTVLEAHEQFGGLDVVVNNAGYGHFGYVEELTESEARAQLETNVFGALWVTQAAIPLLRARGAGHIVQISSIGGIAAFPGLGLYHASKWALEGFSDALSQEVAPFGIKVTLVEPGGYGTDWAGSSSVHSTPDPVYQPQRDARAAYRAGNVPGEPGGVAAAVLELVDADDPPLRFLAGNQAYDTAPAVYAQRLATWQAWEQLSRAAEKA